MATTRVPMTFGLIEQTTKPKKKAKARTKKKTNTYVVVSIRGYDEFIKGTYSNYKGALKVARQIDSYLTVSERRNGSRTEIWTNPSDDFSSIQTVHVIRPRRN